MANSVSHAALPYPIKNARYTIIVPYLDSTGTPTDPTTPDTKFSVDAGAFADCAEEVTTISGSNGQGYITLTGAETNGAMVALAAKVASGPKATLATIYPRVLPIISSGTLSAGSAGGGTLGTILAYDVTGCFLRTTGGTGGGGTGGLSNQARKLITYNQSTGAFTVAPNWETTPDATTTYDLLLPDGMTLGSVKALVAATPGRPLVVDASGLADANVVKLGPTGSGIAQTARDIGTSVLISSGTGTGQLSVASGVVAANQTQVLGAASLPRYRGTARAGSTANTLNAAASTPATDSEPGDTCVLVAGTGVGQSRIIKSVAGAGTATPIITFTEDWPTTIPDGTTQYEFIKTGGAVPVLLGDIWDNDESPSRTLTSPENITQTGNPVPVGIDGRLDVNVATVNDITVIGSGTEADKWRPQ